MCVLGYERHTSGACQSPGVRRVVGPVVRQQEGHLRVFPSEVGGPTPDDDDDEAPDEVPPSFEELHRKTDKSKIKPRASREEGRRLLFYQSLKTKALWAELIHSTSCRKAVVVFTGGDGTLLEACLELQPQHGPPGANNLRTNGQCAFLLANAWPMRV